VKSAAAALLLFCASAQAARADFELPLRGNRREGIVNAHNVSGFQIDLVGLGIEAGRIAADAKRVYLLVPAVSEVGSITISIDEFDSNYRMQPIVTSEKRESQDCDVPLRLNEWFCWPTADVIQQEQVPLSKLVGRAVDAEGVLHPIVLAASAIQLEDPTYVFAVRSAGELSGDWQVLSSKGEEAGSGKVPNAPPGIVEIRWSPKSSKPDWYRFRVDGTVYMEDDVRRARIDKRFRHDPARYPP
jgi:hypothetical protein